MKNMLGIAVVMMLVLSQVSFSQSSASMTANATATIVTGLSCSHGTNSDLAFGKIIASNQAGTVVVSPASARSYTGGAILTTGLAVTAAEFVLSGQASTSVSVTLPSSDVTITSGLNTMKVNTFTSDAGSTPALSASGALTVKVGGTLNVAANQAAGSYTGTFDVTFAY